MNPSVYVCTPTSDGMVHAEYSVTLVREMDLLTRAGAAYVVDVSSRGPHLPASRNRLVENARQAGATHLLWWDSDVVPIGQGYVVKLLTHDKDIVGGAYARKDPTGRLAVDCDEKVTVSGGTFEARRLATGFTLLRMSVFDRLRPNVRRYKSFDNGREEFGFYDYAYDGDIPMHDDWSFCDRARAGGFKINVDPTMQFYHMGSFPFSAKVGRET